MKISSTEEYGLRCMMHVARHFDADTPVTAQEVADAEGISLPYAQKLLRLLGQSDLIDSRRGVGGGYVLARHPDRISLGDVIRALDAEFAVSDVCEKHTGDFATCAHSGECSIKPVWSFIEEFVIRTMDSVPLTVLLGDSAKVREHLRALPNRRELDCPVATLVPNNQ